jgi:hypothetical protein
LKVDTTPALQTFTIKTKKIDALESKTSYIVVLNLSQRGPLQPSQKPVAGTFFAIKFVMSERYQEK